MKLLAAGVIAAVTAGSVTWAAAAPQQQPSAESKTQPGAYWPTMRHDLRNTGASDLPGLDPGTKPWSFQTGKGIFSTPVIAADGTTYVGSADHNLYGLSEEGQEVWRFETGEIIDTAPALLDDDSLIIGSGDEKMYKVSTDPAVPSHQREVWSFEPTLPPVEGQLVSWWEGSPNVGPDGVIYQGNTGGGAYAVNPDGSQKWAYQAQNAVWTVPAMDDSGTTYWGSVDLRLFALNADGTQKWQRTTLGYVTSSPALGPDGTLYAGSFDGTMYALDSADGSVKWKLQTGDHIYASPALVENDGQLEQIIIGSTDGLLYSVNPDGELLWTYDTGAPIRSSPVVGQAPVAGGTPIVYAGAANGRVVAVNVNDGSLRWSYDTTSSEPTLASRNQLNSSPALGPKGVYTGSQDGAVWYVPYDYCLRPGQSDPRCDEFELPTDGMYLFGVDVGGGLVPQTSPARISPAGYMTGRIVVRQQGRTVPARLVPGPDLNRLVSVEPAVEVDVSVSGDGRYVFVRPLELLDPSTTYRVTLQGVVTTGGPRLGNVDLGSGELQPFQGSFTVRTGDDGTSWNPRVGADETSGLSLSRLAVPMPAMLTSVNQIGFDFYDWIGGAVRTSTDSAVVWFVGAQRDEDGTIVADPSSLFAFPVAGQMRGGTFAFNATGVNLWFTFGPVPLQRFDLRGTFDSAGTIRADSQFLAEAVCADIPGYGSQIPATGMCDTQGVITAAGTFLGEQTDASPAVKRVPGMRVGEIIYTPGAPATLSATIDVPTRYTSDEHFASILLVDDQGLPVPIDYYSKTEIRTDADKQITGVTVTVDEQ
ncbi:MAG: PQQ-binding-like beta-propeller repeat protein, partial [Candidatus Nanopelagicales bacterium]|nr:PQQ-binding-like beta-propeller repeat protein [Candidatus Nanopelagicales bacterium]